MWQRPARLGTAGTLARYGLDGLAQEGLEGRRGAGIRRAGKALLRSRNRGGRAARIRTEDLLRPRRGIGCDGG